MRRSDVSPSSLHAAAACALAAASFCGLLVFVLALVLALAVLLTSWRSLLPRKAWEDPSSPQTNRLPTHSRLCNFPTFEEAAAASSGSGSPNVVSLRYLPVISNKDCCFGRSVWGTRATLRCTVPACLSRSIDGGVVSLQGMGSFGA